MKSIIKKLLLSKFILNEKYLSTVYEMFSYISAKYYFNYFPNLISKRFEKKNLELNNYNFEKLFSIHKDVKNKFLLTDTNFTFHKKFNIKKIKSIKDLKNKNIKDFLFYIIFSNDSKASEEINLISKGKAKFYPLSYDWKKLKFEFTESSRYLYINENCAKAINKTFKIINKTKILGNFDSSRLGSHENLCEAIELTKNLKGDILEVGVSTGTSGLTMLNYLNLAKIKKKTYFMDTYSGFDYKEAEESSDIMWNGTHKIMTKKKWKSYLNKIFLPISKNYELIEGNVVRNRLPKKIKKISLVHLDVDMYEVVLGALIKIDPYIEKGGIILCEDAVYTPKLYGAYAGLENFLKSKRGSKYVSIFKKNHFLLFKK